MLEIRRYVNPAGKDVFGEWTRSLRDHRAYARIRVRLARLQAGNFGDCRPVGGGVLELRIDYGPGYRVYLAKIGRRVVLLLGGGDKRRQQADIQAAIASFEEFKGRQQ